MRLPCVPRAPKRKPARSMVELRGSDGEGIGHKMKVRTPIELSRVLDGKFAVQSFILRTDYSYIPDGPSDESPNTRTGDRMETAPKEVLILDTSTFVEEIGLTSRGGSALKHYLYRRGMQLVVPEVVAEECERHLINRARGKREGIEKGLKWLARFCGSVSGWSGPNGEAIVERVLSHVPRIRNLALHRRYTSRRWPIVTTSTARATSSTV